MNFFKVYLFLFSHSIFLSLYVDLGFALKQDSANLIEAYQAAKNVEDWSEVLLEVTTALNGRLKEAVATLDLPRGTWYPKDGDYPYWDGHFEPIAAGVIDGAIDEIKSIPQLINVVVDFSTDELECLILDVA